MAIVSIIIPAYKARDTIGEAVHAALAQTFADLEVIVVDDGSPDDSADRALEAAAGDARLRLIRLPENRGVSAARNAGFAAATGLWIAPLDADDTMAPNRIATLVATAAAMDCDVLVDDLLVELEEGTTIYAFGAERLSETGRITAERYSGFDRPKLGTAAIGYAKPLFKTAFLLLHDVRYREHIAVGEDFDLVMQALLRGADLRFTTYAGYTYRRANSMLTTMNKKRARDAIAASGRELHAEAVRRADAPAAAALEARQRDIERWFDFADLYDALRAGRAREAIGRFSRYPDKRYAIVRLLAFARYDVYKRFGVTLHRSEKVAA